MIDYLIFDKKDNFRLIWSYILKDMNFLIFRDFLGHFSIYLVLHRVLTWQLTWWDVASCRHAYTPHGDVCVHMCVRALA